jgi:drug/metabolite transporter (DMT)-like permease
MGIGVALGLGCALSWAIAVVLFKKYGGGVHATFLNVYKNAISLLLMLPTAYLMEGALWFDIPTYDLSILLLSGFIGIGISDVMFLWALNIIGATRMAITDCLYSPSVIILSFLFLGERLSLQQSIGAAMVVGAVFLVNQDNPADGGVRPKKLILGILVAAASVIGMGAGMVMVKPLFETVPLFFVIEVRLLAGLVGSCVVFLAFRNTSAAIGSFKNSNHKLGITIAAVFATYISMICWVATFKYVDASIAAVLNQTTTVITVILAAIFLKDRLTPLKVLATAVAVAGVLMITAF